MAETLGTLCDKLTIVKLKQWHASDPGAQASLAAQETRLQEEIDAYVRDAAAGRIPSAHLTFAANKVYRKEGNPVADVSGGIGDIFAQLADVNCRLWHVQESVYEFESVPPDRKDGVVKQLAVLNLERTRCIDQLDLEFQKLLAPSPGARTTD
ncbi:MAG TPA: hypothetical protein VL221_11525 [Bacteroidota bacterium]|nr:hypothetical protein [Bacteroidota bacterium]